MMIHSINVWWTGIDTDYCSYSELKRRQVVAQGVPQLGPLTSFHRYLDDEIEFKERIIKLGDATHAGPEHHWWYEYRESNIRKIPQSMYNLLSLAAGDLVVALEGTSVRGICYIPQYAMKSYEYHPAYNYAHSVGFPIKWIDWKTSIFGPPPTAPGQSVYGIRGLKKDKKYVIDCWNKL